MSNSTNVFSEIVRRLRLEKDKGEFKGVHIAPVDSSEVPDEMEARLVILKPELSHTRKATDSEALSTAKEILESKGNSPRLYRNTLVFLAPDRNRLTELEDAVSQYLAWKSIHDEAATLDLTTFAKNQAKTKTEEAERASTVRLHETWSWCLTPQQPNATEATIEWLEYSIPGGDALAKKISKKLVTDEGLFPLLGAPRLKMELDRYLWNDVDHFNVKRLWECFASYLYLPRAIDRETLAKAITSGFTGGMYCEHFGYASSYDEEKNRYTGLQLTQLAGDVQFDGASVLVKPDVSAKQHEAENKQAKGESGGEKLKEGKGSYGGTGQAEAKEQGGDAEEKPGFPKRFFGSVKLNPDRLGRDAGKIAEEVLQHLTTLPGTKVEVTMEIHAEIPDGVKENIQRIVIENSNTLGFEDKGFEQT